MFVRIQGRGVHGSSHALRVVALCLPRNARHKQFPWMKHVIILPKSSRFLSFIARFKSKTSRAASIWRGLFRNSHMPNWFSSRTYVPHKTINKTLPDGGCVYRLIIAAENFVHTIASPFTIGTCYATHSIAVPAYPALIGLFMECVECVCVRCTCLAR